jgi:hypothetical protein
MNGGGIAPDEALLISTLFLYRSSVRVVSVRSSSLVVGVSLLVYES